MASRKSDGMRRGSGNNNSNNNTARGGRSSPQTSSSSHHNHSAKVSAGSSSGPLSRKEKPNGFGLIRHERMMFVLSSLIGEIVDVTLRSGAVFRGVLHACSIQSTDLGIALKCAHLVKDAKGNLVDTTFGERVQYHSTLIVEGREFLSMLAKDVAMDGEIHESSGTLGSGLDDSADQSISTCADASVGKDKFATDTEISAKKVGVFGRKLEKFDDFDSAATTGTSSSATNASPAGKQPVSISSGADMSTGGGLGGSLSGWDQFSANEKKFGVKTNYEEELYTTKLNRESENFSSREKQAARLAAEIEGKTSKNIHILEERGLLSGKDFNEEDLYGAVLSHEIVENSEKAKNAKQSSTAASAPEKTAAVSPPSAAVSSTPSATASHASALTAPSQAPIQARTVTPETTFAAIAAKASGKDKSAPKQAPQSVSVAKKDSVPGSKPAASPPAAPARQVPEEKKAPRQNAATKEEAKPKAAPVPTTVPKAEETRESASDTTPASDSAVAPAAPATPEQAPAVKEKPASSEAPVKQQEEAVESQEGSKTTDKVGSGLEETEKKKEAEPQSAAESAAEKDSAAKKPAKPKTKLNANAKEFKFNVNATEFRPTAPSQATHAAPAASSMSDAELYGIPGGAPMPWAVPYSPDQLAARAMYGQSVPAGMMPAPFGSRSGMVPMRSPGGPPPGPGQPGGMPQRFAMPPGVIPAQMGFPVRFNPAMPQFIPPQNPYYGGQFPPQMMAYPGQPYPGAGGSSPAGTSPMGVGAYPGPGAAAAAGSGGYQTRGGHPGSGGRGGGRGGYTKNRGGATATHGHAHASSGTNPSSTAPNESSEAVGEVETKHTPTEQQQESVGDLND